MLFVINALVVSWVEHSPRVYSVFWPLVPLVPAVGLRWPGERVSRLMGRGDGLGRAVWGHARALTRADRGAGML